MYLGNIPVLFVSLLFYNGCNFGLTFNVDSSLSTVLSGPSNSYFGYSVGVLQVKGKPRVIVGAPKANSSAHPDWLEPGNVYACPIDVSKACDVIDMGEMGDETPENVNRQMLGASLDIWTSEQDAFHRILTCAPSWKNSDFEAGYLLQGRCHEIGYDDIVTFQKIYRPLKTRINYEEQVTKDHVYLKGMGQAGISAQFLQDNSGLLIGAPGLFNWRGGISFINNNTRSKYRPYWLDEDFGSDQYAGYSVASGVFFSDLMVYTVTGVPRWDGVGKVIVFDRNFNHIITERQGTQIGEYFGASVCVTNFNGDRYDDLLVGAPMFSDTLEEGRVYAYVSRGLSIIANNRILRGPGKYRSRFGSAISGIGDVDKDGYNDVAVGAPFIDDHRGAVYIYRGSYSGLTADYSQEILATSVDDTLRGFGWSLSKPLDIDKNEYNDFAVGSFLSDKVVLLKSRPVAKVRADLHLERDVINLMDTHCHYRGQQHACISLEVGFLYTGLYVPENIEIEFELLVDAQPDEDYEVGRAQIVLQGGGTSSAIYNRLQISARRDMLLTYLIIIKPKVDKFTDLVFELRFNKTNFCTPNTDESRCPMLDRNIPRVARKSVSFRKECRYTRGCIADLKIQSTSPKSLVVGGTSFMTMKVIVTNRGEAAYLAMVTIRCQGDIKVAAVDTLEVPRDNPEGIQDIRCSSKTTETTKNETSKTILTCNVGNPLRMENTVVFLVKFDVRELQPLSRFTTVQMEVTTKSTEMNATLFDNYLVKHIALEREVHVDYSGNSRPEQLTYRQQQQQTKGEISEAEPTLLHLDHIITVVNLGESIIPELNVNISVPIATKHGEPLFQITTVELVHTEGSSQAITGGCQTNNLPAFQRYAVANKSVNEDRKARTLNERKGFENVYMNCTSALCVVIPCRIINLRPRVGVRLILYGRIYEPAIVDIQARGIIKLSSNATIWAMDDTLRTTASFSKTTLDVTTDVYPQILGRSRVNDWLLIVCASSGVMLLMFICVALWRAGFFRRAKQEELQRLISVTESIGAFSDSGRGTNSVSTDNETGAPEDLSSAAGNTDSEPPESPKYPNDVDMETLSKSTKKDTESFFFDRPDMAFSNLTYDEATRFGTRV